MSDLTVKIASREVDTHKNSDATRNVVGDYNSKQLINVEMKHDTINSRVKTTNSDINVEMKQPDGVKPSSCRAEQDGARCRARRGKHATQDGARCNARRVLASGVW